MRKQNPCSVKSVTLAILLGLVGLLVGGPALAHEDMHAPGRDSLSAPQQRC
jgi:hypothetical protein